MVPARTCWVSNSPNLPPSSPVTPGEMLRLHISCRAHRQGERSASRTKPAPFCPRSTVSPARWHPWPRCSAPLGPPAPASCPNFGCFSGRKEPQGAEAAGKGWPFIWDRCFPPVSGQRRYLGKMFPVVFQHFLYSDGAIRGRLPGTSTGSGAGPRAEQPKGPRRVSWSISQGLSVAGTGGRNGVSEALRSSCRNPTNRLPPGCLREVWRASAPRGALGSFQRRNWRC